jgi:hypothetical protein
VNARSSVQSDIRERVEALGPWFYNFNLRGVWTAPAHFLGDYPAVKWHRFADAIPTDSGGAAFSMSAATPAFTRWR